MNGTRKENTVAATGILRICLAGLAARTEVNNISGFLHAKNTYTNSGRVKM